MSGIGVYVGLCDRMKVNNENLRWTLNMNVGESAVIR